MTATLAAPVTVDAARAVLQRRAEQLRDSGLGVSAVARELGVPKTTVRRWTDPAYADRLRRLSRDAKRCRTGVCIVCAGKTRLAKGGVPADVCGICAPDHYGPLFSRARKGRGPVTERCRELLAAGPKRRLTLQQELGITSDHTGVLLNRLLRQGYIERVGRGRYQLCSTEKSAPASAAAPSPHKERAQSVA